VFAADIGTSLRRDLSAEYGLVSPLEIWVSTFPESGNDHAQKRE
jgi:hypothetical protein